MKNKLGWAIGALVIVLLAIGVYGTTTAFAGNSSPSFSFIERAHGGPGGPHGGRGLDGAALEAVAEVLGMSTDELSAALESGQSVDYLAGQAGVDMQEIQDALSAVRVETMRERIAQAVEDGSITQEHADWLLEGLEKGFLDGPGFGFGPGFGGHFDRSLPPATPTTNG